MLQKQAVGQETLDLLLRLMNFSPLNDFVLVGGTALTLQIGHRDSIDLDLFTKENFDAGWLTKQLADFFDFSSAKIRGIGIFGNIDGIKVDIIRHPYPYIKDFVVLDGIRMASLEDIVAMKLNAISGNGKRLKDFVDIAFLSSKFSLNEMLSFYQSKYQVQDNRAMMALHYFSDIDHSAAIQLINNPYRWQPIENRINEMYLNPNKIFPALVMNKAQKQRKG